MYRSENHGNQGAQAQEYADVTDQMGCFDLHEKGMGILV